jgi:hypothetical protein
VLWAIPPLIVGASSGPPCGPRWAGGPWDHRRRVVRWSGPRGQVEASGVVYPWARGESIRRVRVGGDGPHGGRCAVGWSGGRAVGRNGLSGGRGRSRAGAPSIPRRGRRRCSRCGG